MFHDSLQLGYPPPAEWGPLFHRIKSEALVLITCAIVGSIKEKIVRRTENTKSNPVFSLGPKPFVLAVSKIGCQHG